MPLTIDDIIKPEKRLRNEQAEEEQRDLILHQVYGRVSERNEENFRNDVDDDAEVSAAWDAIKDIHVGMSDSDSDDDEIRRRGNGVFGTGDELSSSGSEYQVTVRRSTSGKKTRAMDSGVGL